MNPGVIEFDQVTLARGDRALVEGMAARIERGEFIGVFGRNGSGKTTLLNAILGLLRPARGAIRVFGEPPHRGNCRIGYLPQRRSSAAEVHLSGFDFVASAVNGQRWGLPILGLRGKALVLEAIEMVAGEALANRRVAELSGGELQRLLLAQALLGKPELLLLDEPLASLDLCFQHTVVALVRQVQQMLDATVLFIAHDIQPLLGVMDRTLDLGDGFASLRSADELRSGATSSYVDRGVRAAERRSNNRALLVSCGGVAERPA